MQSIKQILHKFTSPNAESVANVDTDDGSSVDPDTNADQDKFQDKQKQPTSSSSTTMTAEMIVFRETVYDLIKDIRDPEKPQSLEDLNVVSEDDVTVQQFGEDALHVKIVFVPTVPHCSLASLIGLCLRQKLVSCFPEKHKLDILVKQGTHETADEINKQINDKERIAAAMENPNLRDLVEKCINDDEYG